MRLYLAIVVVVLLMVSQISSNNIILHHLSLFIEQHWYNNISQIYRLNDCKYSKVKVKASKKIFIIISRTNWCNEVIEMIFGASAKAMRKSSSVIAWTTPYNYSRSIDPVNKPNRCHDDAYFDNATRTAYGLAKVDLFCRRGRLNFLPRIWKRSVQENNQKKHEHQPFKDEFFSWYMKATKALQWAYCCTPFWECAFWPATWHTCSEYSLFMTHQLLKK
ncbi:unnamed protein product [Brugia pahangi]|uniref:Glyco_tran_10_N domain-containing protein n=1 Tax=Brugia pahangi TaxID=6280 RepID=A0A0N4T8M9_BRUPA|nr:unnamed protein product [Brugia pahangi]